MRDMNNSPNQFSLGADTSNIKHNGAESLQDKLDYLDSLTGRLLNYIESEKENLYNLYNQNNVGNMGLNTDSGTVKISDFGEMPDFSEKMQPYAETSFGEKLQPHAELGFGEKLQPHVTENDSVFAYNPIGQDNVPQNKAGTNVEVDELKKLNYELLNKYNQMQEEMMALKSNLRSEPVKQIDEEVILRSRLMKLQEERMGL